MAMIESPYIPLSTEMVQNIIKPVIQDVFEFKIHRKHYAFVEFINSAALKRWLLTNNMIKQKFDVNIKYKIQYVEKDNCVSTRNDASRSLTTVRSTQVAAKNMPSQIKIKISRHWAMIVNHPTFSIDYTNYIRK